LSVGVPGTVAGLALAHEKYGSGKLTLAELIEPAITLARNGVEIVDDIADTLPLAQPRIARWQSSAPVFLNSDGTVLMPGQDLLQPDLAITLRAIASYGPKGFYEGPVADKIVAAVRKAGGIMTTDDMKNYRAILREPVRGTYRGYHIVSMPPPSSGGVHLIEMLNILEGYDLAKLSREESLHIIAEAMMRAYADRATFMGDPDAVKMPVAGLISKKYAAALRAQIGQRATPSTEIRSGSPGDFEGQNTTHFSVIDRDGNAVSNTYTLNFSYGLGLVAEGTGVLLNNELDDFTSKPGTANAYGLVGYNANLPGPNRRPLSSMTPTIVMKDGKPFLITGSPGGSRIISTVLQIITNVIDFNLAIDQAVSAPRVHHQWRPDELYVEPGISPEILEGLVKRGYEVVPTPPQTSANSIEITADGYVGAADRRTRGSLAAGY
jgi:gamma-glutamyltranspeptidase / glutathione hydrolase